MTLLPCPIAPYVPQQDAMCLLEALLAVDDTSLSASVDPATNTLFHRDGAVPGWVALEWLAQGVAAWAGWQAARYGAPPAVGFLVGTRRFTSHRPAFPVERALRVQVTRDFVADNGLAHFAGRVLAADDDTVLAEGRLTIFQPADEEAPHA